MRLMKINLFTLLILGSLSSDLYSQVQRIESIDADTTGIISRPYSEAVKLYIEGLEPKIVGGEKVKDIEEFPWQVSLGVSWVVDPYRAHFCGGSIYNEKWIITAAHCLTEVKARNVAVTAGTIKLGSSSQRRNVRKIIIHENYDDLTFDNDIALVELFTPLSFSQTVNSISLLSQVDENRLLNEDNDLVVLGWGATKEGGKKVRDLRYIDDLPYVERTRCNSTLVYDGMITSNMICAGTMGVDSCQGDSGGPLKVDDDGKSKLGGIVSWGKGCARANKPGVYTRVSNFIDWIELNTR